MTEQRRPAYLDLFASGELANRAASARQRLATCDLCANLCRVDRLGTAAEAACRTGADAIVYSAAPHFGEERPISDLWISTVPFCFRSHDVYTVTARIVVNNMPCVARRSMCGVRTTGSP